MNLDIIKKKERRGLLITLPQILFITCIFSKLVYSHIKILYDPFHFTNIIWKPCTIFYIVSLIHPTLRIYKNRTSKNSYWILIPSLSVSTFIFLVNFPLTTSFIIRDDSNTLFIFKRVLININFCLTVVISIISGITLAYNIRNQKVEYTSVQGIFKYLAISSKNMCNRILNMWFINLGCVCAFILIYAIVGRFLINLILILCRVGLVYNGRILTHMIITYISLMVYYCGVEFSSKILVYNLSLKSKKFTHFISTNDSFTRRYVFYHVSDLSLKYTYVFNKICRSTTDLFNLLDYIDKECTEVRQVCKKMVEEYRLLDTKLYMTVPQVSPNGSLLVKKYKNYNFIDKLTYKIMYLLKICLLKDDFSRKIMYMVDINKYMNCLLKHRDSFLLLVDVDRKYTEIYRDLVDDIRRVEEECGIDLKVTI